MNHLSEDVIWSFLEGDLPESELEAAEEHMAVCDLCCERLANLAELGGDIPELFPLEMPSAGFADRVMAQINIETSAPVQATAENIVPFEPRRKSPRFEVLTRFVTAATVTGFMIFGSVQADNIPVIGSFGKTVTETGVAVSQSTKEIYSQFQYLLDQLIR